jgi:hypothetical protein
VIPVALGIVLIGVVMLTSATVGALAAVALHWRRGPSHRWRTRDRQSCPACVTSCVSLVASGTVLTVRASSLALAGRPAETPGR